MNIFRNIAKLSALCKCLWGFGILAKEGGGSGGTCVLKNFPDLWENLLFLNLTAFETTLMDFEERFETSH